MQATRRCRLGWGRWPAWLGRAPRRPGRRASGTVSETGAQAVRLAALDEELTNDAEPSRGAVDVGQPPSALDLDQVRPADILWTHRHPFGSVDSTGAPCDSAQAFIASSGSARSGDPASGDAICPGETLGFLIRIGGSTSSRVSLSSDTTAMVRTRSSLPVGRRALVISSTMIHAPETLRFRYRPILPATSLCVT